jgi:cytochrome c oxidase accessory protein FixG
MSTLHPSRDSVTTIRSDGSRPYLYPADARGRFATARRWSAFALIAFYLALPWIPINGYPAVFLDIAERRFHLFGITFAAQDMWLLFFVITGLGFSLFFITALLGRVWCGWYCPHTVFLDHVYRRIERLIEGDAIARRQLAAAPLTAGKVARRIAKHGAYIVVSALIMHLFLSYFVSLPEVWSMMRQAPADHWGSFAFMAVSTGILYFNFAWFREQLCIVICPYGRIQSALVDDNSLVVGYDAIRGEPRRGAAVDANAKIGDCVDCNRCVQVCPTGIDIRQGLQMECIGCTACIDACDEVMDRVHKRRGLIRYDSQAGFSGGSTRWFRPRIALYGFLLTAGICVATWALTTFHPANLGVTRIPGAPYISDNGVVRNQFLVRIVNKHSAAATFNVVLDKLPPGITQTGFEVPVTVAPLGEEVRPLVLVQKNHDYQGNFTFDVVLREATGSYALHREVQFLGPEPGLVREAEESEKESKSK